MFSSLTIFPPGFWSVMILLATGAVMAWRCRNDGSGVPILAVLLTVAAWYVGDAFYNDYANNHAKVFDAGELQSAWLEVAWFLVVFLFTAPWIHRWMNARHLRNGSGALQLFRHGVAQPAFQKQLNFLFYGSVGIWTILAVIAAFRLKGEILHFFFPFLGYKAEPWGRNRIGSGFDALLSFAFYVQLLVTAIFGVVAALATDRKVRWLAIAWCFLSWPYFVFDRTRNTLLAVVVPGVMSWGLLRVRGGIVRKSAVLIACFVVVNAWMAFVISNRSDNTIAAAFLEKGFSVRDEKDVHHEGLNMYEELCWINRFLDDGRFSPDWGARYFAEAVNFIPRSLWPGKPTIGIDYAVVRGQGGGDARGAGVYATISTGLIGQGVVNFGIILGPAAAALLMSFWVAILARLDLHIQELGRMPLYACGLILTFNLGRDITLITLYPLVFGAMAIWCVGHFRSPHATRIAPIGPAAGRPRPVGIPMAQHSGGVLRPKTFGPRPHPSPRPPIGITRAATIRNPNRF